MTFSQLLLENDSENQSSREVTMDHVNLSLPRLRAAIHDQRVSFPAQVPIFPCQSRADIQWRLVELYFVHNWSCARLGERYHVAMERIRQLISQWVRRAIVLGYVQDIPPAEALPAGRKTAARKPVPAPAIDPAHLARTAVAAS